MRLDFFQGAASSVLVLITGLAVLATVAGCTPSPEEQKRARLEQFASILPPKIRENFENRKYERTVIQIDSLLATDREFASRWAEMKQTEAIGLFSTAEVIDYFVGYFGNYRERR